MSEIRDADETTEEVMARRREGARESALGGHVDSMAARQAVSDLLLAIGFDPESERFRDTPERVATAFAELTTPEPVHFSTFPNTDGYAGPILVNDIAFISLCEHHLLPFRGSVNIGYIPGERIAGLSVLAQVVSSFSRDLLLQETLTQRIAEALNAELQPQALGVVIEAEHMCMVARGPKAVGSRAVTSVFLGERARDPEFLAAFAVSGVAGAETNV